VPAHPLIEGNVALDVAYGGSLEAQELDLRMQFTGPAEVPLAPWAVGTLVECINAGLAGGAEFAPEQGFAELLSGPTGAGDEAPGELGPSYAFRLRVKGVLPRFLRNFAEYFASAGAPSQLVQLSMVGSRPRTEHELFVREREVLAWLAEPDAYAGVWPELGFPLKTGALPRGATLHLQLAKGNVDAVAPMLEEMFSCWQSAVLTYPRLSGVGPGVTAPHASFARAGSEFFAKLDLFDHVRAPARHALANALRRVHVQLAPLAFAEIATP